MVKHVFTKNINLVNKYKAIFYNYKTMGVSPTIIPVNYKDTVNNTKKIVRNNVYSLMSKHLKHYCIVDFDYKSCYTSILLKLYPQPLNAKVLIYEII